jgi:predicted AAA+ superfamily ATPase
MYNWLYRQKEELAKFFDQGPFVAREGLEMAIKSRDDGLIKAILGPRRAGKSVFAYLLLKDTNFAYVNFDDNEAIKVLDSDKLTDQLGIVYPGFTHILFDKIQNFPNWELYVNKLQRRGYKMVITGSNSNLLSQELGSHLTGRYSPYEVLPFSYKEYLNVSPSKINRLPEYLQEGGYPEVIIKKIERISYLSNLLDAIISKDITGRYKLTYPQRIRDLARYLLANFACEHTPRRLASVISAPAKNPSMVIKYLNFLHQSYLIMPLERYSYKFRERIVSPKKYYLSDTGFAPVSFSQNIGSLLENAIFLQLMRQGYKLNYDLFYFKTKNGKEVDFVTRDGLKVNNLIQVCTDLTDPKTLKREVSALHDASKELDCPNTTLIAFETPKVTASELKITNLWTAEEWLRTSN